MTAKRVLTYVGTFREFGYPNGASLVDARGRLLAEDKGAIVAYLRAAPMIVWSAAIHVDIFDPTKGTYLNIATDGRFAWHRALDYYVEKYDVELPAEFERHMRQNAFKIPENLVTKDLALPQAP